MQFRVWDSKWQTEAVEQCYISEEGILCFYKTICDESWVENAPEHYHIEYYSDKYKVYENDKITWLLRGSIIEGVVKRKDDEFWVTDLDGGNPTRLNKVRKLTVIGRIMK